MVQGVITTSTLREAKHKRNGPKRIYAYNVPCQYIVAREKVFYNKVLTPLDVSKRVFFEVIEEEEPCHLYIDIDVDRVKFPAMDVDQIMLMVCGHVEYALNGMQWPISDKIISDSTDSAKGSIHIIYKLKDKIWESNAHVGAFMRRCMQLRVKKFEEDYQSWILFVDMCVYSRNRLFRMLGCTKKHQNRTKVIRGEVFNFANWKRCQVQPLDHNKLERVTCEEPDGSPARYMGSKVGNLGTEYAPSMRENMEIFANTMAPVRAVTFVAPYRLWFVNLIKHDCVFKKSRHSKNTNYIVITQPNFMTGRGFQWYMKCWNSKYECCKDSKTELLDLPEHLKSVMLKYETFIVSPSISTC